MEKGAKQLVGLRRQLLRANVARTRAGGARVRRECGRGRLPAVRSGGITRLGAAAVHAPAPGELRSDRVCQRRAFGARPRADIVRGSREVESRRLPAVRSGGTTRHGTAGVRTPALEKLRRLGLCPPGRATGALRTLCGLLAAPERIRYGR